MPTAMQHAVHLTCCCCACNGAAQAFEDCVAVVVRRGERKLRQAMELPPNARLLARLARIRGDDVQAAVRKATSSDFVAALRSFVSPTLANVWEQKPGQELYKKVLNDLYVDGVHEYGVSGRA